MDEFSYRPFLKTCLVRRLTYLHQFPSILFDLFLSSLTVISIQKRYLKIFLLPFSVEPEEKKVFLGRETQRGNFTLHCKYSSCVGFCGKSKFWKSLWNWIRKELLFLKKKLVFAFVGRLKWPKRISAAPLLFR